MATPDRIKRYVETATAYVKEHLQDIQDELNRQRAEEQEIIENTDSFCPISQLQNRTVRSEDIKRALKEGIDDANVLKTLMCVNNSVVIFPSSAGEKSNLKMREYLHNLRQMGGESVEGYAMLADVKGERDLFVVKSPRRIDAYLKANQIHEYFVMAFGTNQLRSRIPNFAFGMGLFQCSPPYIDSQEYLTGQKSLKDKRALTYCQNDVSRNQVNYILYENIDNSTTFKDYILDGCSYPEFINLFTQTVLASDLAKQVCDFTHGDLHDENALVRTLTGEEIAIPYPVDEQGTIKYLRTKNVLTFIDFGRSHIKYNGRDYGYELISHGLYPDRSYAMYDIYKLLMFSLMTAAFGDRDMRDYVGFTDNELINQNMIANPDVFQNVKELIVYFVPDLPRERLTNYLLTGADYLINTREFYYSLPYSSQFNIRPIRFFQNVMMPTFGNVINEFLTSDPGNLPVYGCANKGTCQSPEQALSNYTAPDTQYTDDAHAFYEVITENPYDNYVIEQGKYRYPLYIDQLIRERELLLEEYKAISNDYQIISLSASREEHTFTNIYLDKYRHFVAKTVKLVDILTSLAHIEDIISTLTRIYNPSAHHDVNYLAREQSNLNQAIRSIHNDVEYIRTLSQKYVLGINKNAIWLFQKMPSLIAAITEFH